MAYNMGAGTDDPAVCAEMADRLEAWMADHRQGDRVHTGLWKAADGRVYDASDLAADPGHAPVSPDQVHVGLLSDWIEFLRNCGGFGVW